MDVIENQKVMLNNQALILEKQNAILRALGVDTVSLKTVNVPEPMSIVKIEQTENGCIVTEETVNNEAEQEIDSAGVPWNPDFHSDTKSQKNDGTWKSRRGVNKEAKAAYDAQFVKAETPKTPAPPVTTPPTTPAPPVTTPAPPVTVENELKTKCAETIKTLTDDFKTPYLQIVDKLFKPFGADIFDQVPEDKLSELLTDLKSWLSKVEKIDDAVNKLLEIDEATQSQYGLSTHVKNIIGGDSAGKIPFDSLDEKVNEVLAFADQWAAWFAQQPK